MDHRLREASISGDVHSLHQLLQEDRLLLNRPTYCCDNPLHVAATLGHADFAAEVLRLRPDLARELDLGGHTPLHLAAANGHAVVAKVLLGNSSAGVPGHELCLLRDMDWLTPIHAAALKGRTDVLRELVVGACPESVHATTGRGETALHLAVRSSSFEAVEFLVETVAAAAELLNSKDDKGNTALHLAVARRQLQQTVGGRELRQPEGPDTLGRPARVPKRAVRGHGAGRDDPCSGRQDRCRTEASSASSSTTSPSQSTPKAACQARRVPGHPRHAHGGGHADSNHHVPGGAESPRRVHSRRREEPQLGLESGRRRLRRRRSAPRQSSPGEGTQILPDVRRVRAVRLPEHHPAAHLRLASEEKDDGILLVDNMGRGAVHRAGLPVRDRADVQEQRRRPQPVLRLVRHLCCRFGVDLFQVRGFSPEKGGVVEGETARTRRERRPSCGQEDRGGRGAAAGCRSDPVSHFFSCGDPRVLPLPLPPPQPPIHNIKIKNKKLW
ncbi:putative ankyrin-1 [Iris pallida]|uniref:Ankyrin-1 n=1 Tax=Iris pallida TaxID=29817 RepID=A0AAX6FSA3_IRIPA|nr:putative ankyrin-1 [Iris pallida]